MAFIKCLLMVFCFSSSGFAQKNKYDLKNIETINNSYFTNGNQVIRIDYLLKNRYKSRLFNSHTLIQLGSTEKYYQDLSFIDSFLILFQKADKYHYYYKHRDSLNYKKKPLNQIFDLKKGKIPSRFYFLSDLPISSAGFYSKKHYSSAKIIYKSINSDTVIIEQKGNKTSESRKIFIDSNLHIFKIEFNYIKESDICEKKQICLQVYPNLGLNHVADSFDFGPYKKTYIIEKKAIINKDSILFKTSRILIPLINNKVLEFDSSKIKYYIVDLWYIGCKPCHLSRPYLEKINDKLDTTKTIMLGFNHYDTNEDIFNFNKVKSFRINEIDKELFNLCQLKTDVHPTVLILDSNFNIIEKYIGLSNINILNIMLFLKKNKLLK